MIQVRKRFILPLVAIAGVIAALASASAVPLDPAGDLDTANFNSPQGKNQHNFALVQQFGEAADADWQSNGKLVIAARQAEGGSTFQFAALRLNADGTQDMSFGQQGNTRIAIGSNSFVNAVKVDAQDRIVIVGFALTATNDFAIARLTKDGVIDTTFGGGDGIVTVDFGGTDNLDRGLDVAIQDDGKIVAVGQSRDNAAGAGGVDIGMVRLQENGELDPDFGRGGKVITPVAGGLGDDRGNSILIHGTGASRKILVGGRTRPAGGSDATLLLVQYTTAGALDNTFNGDGRSIVDIPSPAGQSGEEIRGIARQADGKIVATGIWGSSGTFPSSANSVKSSMLNVRFTANGDLDTTFSNDLTPGYDIVSIARGYYTDIGLEIAVGTDGKITAFGWTDQTTDDCACGVPPNYRPDHDFLFARYLSTGARDTSFQGGFYGGGINQTTPAPDGISIVEVSDGFTFDDAEGLVLDPNNQPIGLGARTYQDGRTDTYIAAAKVGNDGEPDHTFGPDINPANGTPDGFWFVQLERGSADTANGIAVAPNGTYVVAGGTDSGASFDFAAVRYNANGTVNQAFSGTNGTRDDTANAVAVQPWDSKIVLAGGSTGGAGTPSFTVMRFNTNGTLDTSFDGDGIATTTFGTNGNTAFALAIDGTSHDIYVGGSVSDSSGNWDFGLARFNENGSLDTGFDGDGKARLDVGTGQNFDQINAIVIQPDGKVVVGGYSNSSTGIPGSVFALARYNANGSLDTGGFAAPNGFLKQRLTSNTLAFAGDEIRGLALTADGHIVAAGKGSIPTLYQGSTQGFNGLAVAQFTSAGVLDTTYGTNGFNLVSLGSAEMDEIKAIAMQRDEKIIAVGNAQQLDLGNFDTVITRFNWTGTLDTTYGTNGFTRIDFDGFDQGNGVAVISSGKAVSAVNPGSNDLGIMQHLGDPAPTLPGVPDLSAASDSGRFNDDNITNDNTPTFTGTCVTGETIILKRDGTTLSPLVRALCASSAYSLTAPSTTDGVHTFSAFARNGSPADSATTATISVTVDTVVNAPTISAPAAASDVLPNPTISGAGAEDDADVNVTNNAGGAAICTDRADPAGTWTCNSTLAPGSYTIAVRQVDIAGNTSSATTRAFNVKAATTTTLISSGSPTVYGQSVTFTATVAAVGPYGTPNGNLRFDIDGGSGGGGSSQTVALNGAGVASLPLTSLSVGDHTVSAHYLGATLYFPSASDTVNHHVDKADTTTALGTSVTPTVFGQNVTFAVALLAVAPGGGIPDGTVTFKDGATTLGTQGLSNGQAILMVSSLPVGTHNVTAEYSGSSNYNGSTSDPVEQVVNKANTTVTITSDSPDPSDVGAPVPIQFVVAPVAPGAGSPTGQVTVSDGDLSCTATVSAGQCSLTFLTVGQRTLTATYAGDSNFNGAASPSVSHSFNKVDTTTAITAVTPSPAIQDRDVTIQFSVTPNIAGAGTPTGNVTVSDGSGHDCTVPVASGQCVIAFPDAAAYALSATYGGDADFAGSTTASSTGLTVRPAARVLIDTAGGVAVDETGPTVDTYTAVLSLQPDADVVVEVTADAQTRVSSDNLTFGASVDLTFTSANWNTPQTVYVRAVDDAIDESSPHTSSLAHAITTTATFYSTEGEVRVDGIATDEVTANITDNDSAGITVDPTSGLETTEAGGQATFTVVLTSQPTANVTVGVSSSDATEGTAAPASLTFTSGDWNAPQTVTVTGVDDSVDDGDVAFTVVTAAATSTDPNYSGLDAANVGATNTDDDTAGVKVTPTTGTTTEAGGTATYDVSLTSMPLADVSIAFSGVDASEGSLDVPGVTIAPADWDQPVTVTVTGVNDDVDDGDQQYDIMLTVTSADADYSGISAPSVKITNTDDDFVGVRLTPVSGLTTTEAGGTATVDVTLGSEPAGEVTVNLASSDTGEGTVGPAALTFDASTWKTPQTVTLTGVDDLIDDGDVAWDLQASSASSADSAYSGLTANASATNTDDDTAGVNVSAAGALVTTEAGGVASFDVVLTSQPTADVTIAVASDDTSEGVSSPASLVFTPANWNVAQSVDVTGQDDNIDDGDVAYHVQLSVSAGDANYLALTIPDRAATNQDDDAEPQVSFTVEASDINEGDSPAQLTVALSRPSGQSVTVDYAVTGGTATGGGTDYTLAAGTVTFDPLDTSESIAIDITDDVDDESDETVVVTLSNPVNASLGDLPAHTLTILDDDITPLDLPIVAFSAGAAEGSESKASVKLDVKLSKASAGTVSVKYGVGGGGADNGVDYNLAAGTLTFAPGQTSKQVTVTVVNDTLVESDETLMVKLSSPVNATLGNPSELTYTIDDDDFRMCDSAVATITGSDAVDVLTGTPGDDVIVGMGGSDVIRGNGGNDVICGGLGDDRIFGGDGDDTIQGGDGNDTIVAGGGNDTIRGLRGDDTVRGGTGNDRVFGGRGAEKIFGGGGDDALFGRGGADGIEGGAGRDLLRGGDGNDRLSGGGGNDRVSGGAGNDQVDGDGGGDGLAGGPGTDDCDGGPGTDHLAANARCETVAGIP